MLARCAACVVQLTELRRLVSSLHALCGLLLALFHLKGGCGEDMEHTGVGLRLACAGYRSWKEEVLGRYMRCWQVGLERGGRRPHHLNVTCSFGHLDP